MIHFSADAASHLASVASRLHAVGYPEAVRTLCGDVPVYRHRRAMRELCDATKPVQVDAAAWAAVSLFFLGRPLPMHDARTLLGASLETLLTLGVLAVGGTDVRSDRCGVVDLHDALFLVSRLKHERAEPGANAAYLGHDTIELLTEALDARSASMLELGCGGGLVGILAQRADPSRHVVGTELCQEAVEIARVNAAMNEVAYDVRLGDLYQPAHGERFDLILADPPCVAVPDDLAFPLYGAGGHDGDTLLRRIVAGADDHLTPEGRLVAVTELQCVPGELPFVRWLEAWCDAERGRQAHVTVMASRHFPPDYHQSLGDNVWTLPQCGEVAAMGGQFASYAAARRLYFGYWVQVRVRRAPEQPSSCAIEWRFPRANAGSRLLVPDSHSLARRVASVYRHEAAQFNQAFRWFVEHAATGRTPADLATALDHVADDSDLTTYFVDLTTAFGQLGFIQFDSARTAS